MPLNIGDPAPDFALKDILTGQTHKLSDYKPHNVFLIFSGPSWCPPCQFEAPVLEELWLVFCLAFPRTQFLMVSVNEEEGTYKNAVQNFGLTFPCLYDPTDSIWTQYLVQGVPTVYVIDGEDKVCNVHLGVLTPADALYAELYSMLLSCGSSDQGLMKDASRWAAVAIILFGIVQDGGGLAITPGGKPIPIDPLGPLRRMSPDTKDVVLNLAIAELARSVRDPGTAAEIQLAAVKAAEASVGRLVIGASKKPLQVRSAYSAVKRK